MKKLSIILLAILFCLNSAQVMAQIKSELPAPSPAVIAPLDSTLLPVLGRTVTANKFLLPDGKIQAEIYISPVNYLDKTSGTIKPATSSPVLSTTDYVINEAFYFKAPQDFSKDPIEFTAGTHTATMLLDGSVSSTVTKGKSNELLYPGILKNIDAHIFLTPSSSQTELWGPVSGQAYIFYVNGDIRSYDSNGIDFTSFTLPLPFIAWNSLDPLKTFPATTKIDELSPGSLRLTVTVPSIAGLDRLHPTLTLQPDATDGLDNMLYRTTATTNYGTLPAIQTSNGSAYESRPVMKFDLSSIPTNAVPFSATRSVWLADSVSLENHVENIYPLLRSWTEAGSTWNTYDGSNNWGTAGAKNTSTDVSSVSMGNFTKILNDSFGTQYDSALDLTTIQGWISDPSSNFGMLDSWGFVGDGDYANYESSDSGTPSIRPKLVVVYAIPSTKRRSVIIQ